MRFKYRFLRRVVKWIILIFMEIYNVDIYLFLINLLLKGKNKFVRCFFVLVSFLVISIMRIV